ncbi:MAG: hypothetical protein ACRDSE_16745 [Pseudonocardiaceae bacterium]
MTALILGTATGVAEPGTSSAFGVSAEGVIPIDPTPFVESTDGTEVTDSAVNIPLGENGEVNVGKVLAGNNTASVTLADATLGQEGLGEIVVEISKLECNGSESTLTIASLTVDGEEQVLPGPTEEEVIDLQQLGSITIHEQIDNPDGTYTANGVVINLLPDTEAEQTVTLASVTCGGPAKDDGDNGDGDNGDDDGDNGDGDNGPTATKPAPITTGLPVTG